MKPILQAACLALLAFPAFADDAVLTFKDGGFTPARLEVAAGDAVKITLVNAGTEAVEFESHALHKEKLLAPGASVVIELPGIKAGDYDFFDDFHPDAAKGVIAVK